MQPQRIGLRGLRGFVVSLPEQPSGGAHEQRDKCKLREDDDPIQTSLFGLKGLEVTSGKRGRFDTEMLLDLDNLNLVRAQRNHDPRGQLRSVLFIEFLEPLAKSRDQYADCGVVAGLEIGPSLERLSGDSVLADLFVAVIPEVLKEPAQSGSALKRVAR